ncbi:MAG: hypothetical protein WAK93_08605 [Solirubrobacteraceae bacterium]
MKRTLASAVREFKALSPVRQAAIVAITAWNLWLSAAAERDIQRAPAAEVRGGKAIWRLAALTNTVGPLAYFRWGRRGSHRRESGK